MVDDIEETDGDINKIMKKYNIKPNSTEQFKMQIK